MDDFVWNYDVTTTVGTNVTYNHYDVSFTPMWLLGVGLIVLGVIMHLSSYRK